MTILGGGGLAWVFKFQREDAGKAIEQVNEAMVILRGLNDDILESLERVESERDAALRRLAECHSDRQNLKRQILLLERGGNSGK